MTRKLRISLKVDVDVTFQDKQCFHRPFARIAKYEALSMAIGQYKKGLST